MQPNPSCMTTKNPHQINEKPEINGTRKEKNPKHEKGERGYAKLQGTHGVPDETLILEVLAHPGDGQGTRGFHDAPSVVKAQLDGLFVRRVRRVTVYGSATARRRRRLSTPLLLINDGPKRQTNKTKNKQRRKFVKSRRSTQERTTSPGAPEHKKTRCYSLRFEPSNNNSSNVCHGCCARSKTRHKNECQFVVFRQALYFRDFPTAAPAKIVKRSKQPWRGRSLRGPSACV